MSVRSLGTEPACTYILGYRPLDLAQTTDDMPRLVCIVILNWGDV